MRKPVFRSIPANSSRPACATAAVARGSSSNQLPVVMTPTFDGIEDLDARALPGNLSRWPRGGGACFPESRRDGAPHDLASGVHASQRFQFFEQQPVLQPAPQDLESQRRKRARIGEHSIPVSEVT